MPRIWIECIGLCGLIKRSCTNPPWPGNPPKIHTQPLTPIRGFGTPENHWRHFEWMHRWPTGFVVTGDAVCAFNPICGQGMTVSVLDAMTIQQCLQEHQRAQSALRAALAAPNCQDHIQSMVPCHQRRPALANGEVETCSSKSSSTLPA